MTTYLLYDTNVNTNITTQSHSSTGGSVTAVTPISNIANRSLLDTYEFTTSVSGTSSITINFNNVNRDVSSFALLNCYYLINQSNNLEIEFRGQIGNNLIYTADTVTTTRSRVIDGKERLDNIWIFPEIQNVLSVVIKFDNAIEVLNYVYNPQIGAIHIGKALELKVLPDSLNYNFGSEGTKLRSEGGQVVASTNNSYMLSTFNTIPTKESTVVSEHHDINYKASVSQPIIFIPQSDENIILYGTQKKANSTKTVLARDSESNEWLYQTSFSIEEEF